MWIRGHKNRPLPRTVLLPHHHHLPLLTNFWIVKSSLSSVTQFHINVLLLFLKFANTHFLSNYCIHLTIEKEHQDPVYQTMCHHHVTIKILKESSAWHLRTLSTDANQNHLGPGFFVVMYISRIKSKVCVHKRHLLCTENTLL